MSRETLGWGRVRGDRSILGCENSVLGLPFPLKLYWNQACSAIVNVELARKDWDSFLFNFMCQLFSSFTSHLVKSVEVP